MVRVAIALRRLALLGPLAATVAWAAPQHPAGQEPPPADRKLPGLDRRVARLVADLDADHFTVRERAERELIDLGLAALPGLEPAQGSTSPEVRHRARRIAREIEHRALLADFRALAAVEDDAAIDVERAMWLVARISNPRLELATISRQLDALAARVRSRLADVAPQELNPSVRLAAVRHVLFAEEGFTGNAADYYAPENSSIDRVLATRRGLPITLSHLMIAVGRRVDLPLVGLQIPSRYMVKLDPPPGMAEHEIVIDPFTGGRTYNNDELEDVIAGLGFGFDPARHLQPSRHRASVERMLSNLVSNYGRAGDHDRAERTQIYLNTVQSRGRE